MAGKLKNTVCLNKYLQIKDKETNHLFFIQKSSSVNLQAFNFLRRKKWITKNKIIIEVILRFTSG